ncbi:unnamed protein product [Calypogeia fissa]
MATIIAAGRLHAAVVVESRLKYGLGSSMRRTHLELSFPFRKGGQLGRIVQISGGGFRKCSGATCSVGNGDIRASDNVKKLDTRRFSNRESDHNGSHCVESTLDTGFRVLGGESDFTKNAKAVGMLLGGVVLALGFSALRFCKPAYAASVVESPPTVSTPLTKNEELKPSETEAALEHKSEEDVVTPEEDQSSGEIKENSGAEGEEFEPPFGEGSDLTNDPAEVLLRSYLQMNPADMKALQALLFLRLKKGEVKAAGPVLNKLIELEPDNLEWKYIKAQADEFAGDLETARRGFEEILQIRPLSARAWQGLAVVMHKTGEDEEALKMLNEAVKTAVDSGQSKESINLRMLLGQLHTMQGDLDKAMELYQLVVEEDPQDYRPYLCQGLVYSIIGEEAEAEKYFRRYRKLCPKDLQQRGFLDELMLRAKTESKELHERVEKEEQLKKKGKKVPKAMRQPLASGGVPKDDYDAR